MNESLRIVSEASDPSMVFVGGAPRSGTTLLQTMLDSHPRIYGAPEFLHLPDLGQLRRKMLSAHARGYASPLYDPERLDRVLRQAIRELLLPLMDSAEHDVFVEKTPSNVLVFDQLHELFPEARFLFMVRDPRATVASLLEVGKRGRDKGWHMPRYTNSTAKAAFYVKTCVVTGLAFAEEHPDCTRTVFYERLVAEPRRESQELCEFLGLPWDERMLNPGAIDHPGAEAIINDVWYDRESYHRDPVQTEVDKWRQQLSAGQLLEIREVWESGARFESLGYQLSEPSIPAVARLRRRVLGLPRRARSRLKTAIRSGKRSSQ